MPYAPRKRQLKWHWKVMIPIVIFIMLFAYLMTNVLIPNKEKEEVKFSVCGLNETESVEKINKTSADTFVLKDYLYYGESLNLYEEPYSPTNEDNMAGKSVELHNVCNDETISMIIQSNVDQRISLEDLEPGFYDISILDHQIKKRFVFENTLKDNSYTTVKRNGIVKRIQVIANKNLLKDQNIQWDQNYLFLQIDEVEPSSDDIDVLIDPYGMNMDVTYTPDEGNVGNGLVENTEMFEAANIMKEELEQYGLRVAITKKSVNDSGKAYGEDGRLSIGYKKNARYYLNLRFSKDTSTSVRGMEIQNSAYASSALAKMITYELERNIDMPLCGVYSGENSAGILQTYFVEGMDGKQIYDGNLYLRESGGRATLAGKYSENSQKENASFVSKNGMLGLEINFGYVSNERDATLWKEKKETIVKETAKAFAEGINVIEIE